MSGHLVTILCTLVCGFVSDFANAGAQEVKLKRIDFLFQRCLKKKKNSSCWILPCPCPPWLFCSPAQHLQFSGAFGSEQGSSTPAGVKYSTTEAQRDPGLSLVPNCLSVGASLYGFFFVFPSKVTVPRITCGERLWGLGVSALNPWQKINVFQEQLSATLLFFHLPCNKPIFRRFLHLWCKALSSCNLGAVRRIKHWLRCEMIPVPAALACSSLLREAEVSTVHLTHFLFSSSTSPFPAPKTPSGNCN